MAYQTTTSNVRIDPIPSTSTSPSTSPSTSVRPLTDEELGGFMYIDLDNVVPPNSSMGNLSLTHSQQLLLKQYLADKQTLIGLRLKQVFDEHKNPISSRLFLIVGFSENEPTMLRVLDEQNDDVFDVYLWQLDIPSGIVLPVIDGGIDVEIDSKVKRIMDKVVLEPLAGRMQSVVNMEYNNKVNNIKSMSSQIQSNRQSVLKLENDLKNLIHDMENAKKQSFSVNKLLSELAQIKKHDKVEDVYITKNSNIFIRTKMLKKTNPKTGKVSQFRNIGRFMIVIKYTEGGNYLRVHNLDFYVGDSDYFDHPTIRNGELCRGNNENEIMSMYRNCQLYQLIDFLIMFLSIYPQDSGSSPYMDYSEWWNDREKREEGTLPSYLKEERI